MVRMTMINEDHCLINFITVIIYSKRKTDWSLGHYYYYYYFAVLQIVFLNILIFFRKKLIFLYVLNCFDVLILKIIFKK
jgi:hypothetical protein